MMTTLAATSVPKDIPTGTLLLRAATAEWTRLWTVRSTWWALSAGAALMLFIGAAAGAGHEGGDPAPIWQPAQLALAPGQFAFLLVVLLAVTGEYSTGAIHSTLQWVPRRGITLVVRLLVPVGSVTACAAFVSAVTGLVVWGFVSGVAEVVAADIAASLGKIALVVAFGGLLAGGFGLLLRSAAGTLTTLFLLILALPIALGNSGVPWLMTISDHLPGRAIVSVLDTGGAELSASTIVIVMFVWTAVAVVTGGWSLLRRDID